MSASPITTLLVIEDNPGDARLLREMFEEGVSRESTMIQIDTMAEAERHLAIHVVDVILLDLGLPDAQGLAAVERAHRAAPGVPLVVVTGLDDETMATQALQIGAQDYLLKGQIDARSLSRALRYAIERSALDTALFTEKERAQVTLNSIGDAVASTDPNGCITYINLVASELTGWTFADAAGQSISTILNMQDGANHVPIDFGPHDDKPRDEIRLIPAGAVLVRRDGRDVGVEGSIAPIHDRRGRRSGSVVVFRDVTERRLVERDMRRSEERFRRLFDANTIGITIADMSGRTLEANDAYLAMLGYTRADLLETAVDWDSLTPSEHRGRSRETVAELRANGIARAHEMEFTHKDGHRVPALVGVAVLEAAEETCISYVVDLSSRRLLEEQLRQAQKMEAVGQLAGGVAHDFNNLLTVILGHASELLAGLPDDRADLRESAEEIRDAGDRATAMTRRLLAFSRRLVLAPALIDVNQLVATIERLLRGMIGDDVTLSIVASTTPSVVLADIGQIEQVLMNLAINARDAMPDGGSITITVADATLSDAGPAATTGLPLGDYVTIVVADSGIGMSAETQRHMFEPFFTTKGADRGTGLGLATAYGIVRQSGGSIVVESSLGAGAAFTIYLPRLDATAAAKQLRPVPLAHVPAAGMVLLVEDDPSVRRLIQRMLTGLGYEVIAAAVGSEAIAVARGHVGPIHVLLTDVVMAGMSGRELAAILVSERADTRVVFMSGYPDETVLRQDLGHVSFVQKPFTVDTLAESLRAAIA